MFRLTPPGPATISARCEHTETSDTCSVFVDDAWSEVFDPRTFSPVSHERALAEGAVSEAGFIQHDKVADLGYIVRKVRRQCSRGGTWHPLLDMQLCPQHAERLALRLEDIVLHDMNAAALDGLVSDRVQATVRDALAGRWAA